jgi:hypothetical protein
LYVKLLSLASVVVPVPEVSIQLPLESWPRAV